MNFTIFPRTAAWLGLVLTATALTAKADMIELVNGDHYLGTVIGMTQSNIDFLSEIQGRVKLPRDKVAQITLHAVAPKPVAKKAAPAPAAAPLILSGPQDSTAAAPAGSPAALASAPSTNSADAMLQQMRQQGVDPKLISQVQQQILGQSNPAASQKFNEMMNGLMSGSISMNDLRAQAQSSIAQIQAAKKELGNDDGGILDGYLAILQSFMNESATDTAVPAAKPKTDGVGSGN